MAECKGGCAKMPKGVSKVNNRLAHLILSKVWMFRANFLTLYSNTDSWCLTLSWSQVVCPQAICTSADEGRHQLSISVQTQSKKVWATDIEIRWAGYMLPLFGPLEVPLKMATFQLLVALFSFINQSVVGFSRKKPQDSRLFLSETLVV